jgi:MFS transporter, YNFM family, putative membrane transport protein
MSTPSEARTLAATLPPGSLMTSPAATDATHGVLARSFVIGLTAFLTLVDLFATQAILPSLARAYGVSPASMGLAVNASTIGMAVAGLVVAFFSQHIDRRRGIVASLGLLAVPTALLAVAPDLATFAALRIAQGLCMSAAFALTLSYLAEQCSERAAAGAFAAYITGNVASNLVGRLMSAALADTLGLAGNFYVFAALNLSGAVLVYLSLRGTPTMATTAAAGRSEWSIWAEHLRNKSLRLCFALGFLILFVFLGVFTFVNFVLASPPLSLAPMSLGIVYLVFAPSILTTPLAGRAVRRFGARRAILGALASAAIGLALLVSSSLPSVLMGMVLVAAGTFFAQAITTGYVGRVATTDRASASGIYLASYFFGGMAGTAVLGQIFDRFGWSACVAAILAALVLAAILATRLKSDAAV